MNALTEISVMPKGLDRSNREIDIG